MYKTLYSRGNQAFLELLIQSRLEAQLTQAELALRLQEDQSWVSKVERGVRRLDFVELSLWCKAIEMPVHEFVHRYEACVEADNLS
ncbi:MULTISPECIES: helix-turn-helix domain-containing protein [Comamonas]|jgi:hypothetical protein|uniref:helix-turn-helix domain-containing protein n=1 Tax=Comamonas TaxID=283 RepID=UPI00050FA38C|nr:MULTISPECIES: helix-turn-helix transcriptional regulator [Comamonas]KGG92566.1 hypothetical protein P369_09245 [Comamonas thiooxydans]KGG98517.1 hypothetical protein P367_12150 [Comamonas thiooxydans]KGH04464.1 hypothetical protein P365_12305 [Comamonas thiooxydans]KGH12974.1 hypothetical protein P368_10490 [Comamonas thiooxydans]TZG06849.1 helix-turn-helix transcriptional regulator [Comamonas thiooxydans]